MQAQYYTREYLECANDEQVEADSSEWTRRGMDIVLKAPANYQKRAGTVILSRSAFRWEPSLNVDSTAAVAIPVTQIRAQQCGKSTDEQPKIKLLHRDKKSSFVFEFTGGSSALADRNALRDALASMIDVMLQSVTKEVPEIVEQRSRLLSRNAELKALYEGLVNGGVVAEDEFWEAQRVDDVITAMKMTAGFESAMATDDQASSGGANTLVHTLTSLKMRQIFFENPNLERLWKEQVPHQVRAAFRNCPLHLSWRVRAAAQTGACRS